MVNAEEWRPVAGYECIYGVSDLGRVRSVKTHHVLSFSVNPGGYLVVALYKNGVRSRKPIHRLVAEAFVPGKQPSLMVCHNDGNKFNNYPSNLRWDTSAGNAADSLAHGTNANQNKTLCKRGHPLSNTNLYVDRDKKRRCRACAQAALIRHRQKA